MDNNSISSAQKVVYCSLNKTEKVYINEEEVTGKLQLSTRGRTGQDNKVRDKLRFQESDR